MDDKDLRTMFRETRVADHRSSPGFESDWEAARSRLALGHKGSFTYAIAAACIGAIALAVALGVRVAVRRSTIPQHSARGQDLDQGLHGRPPALTGDTTAVLTPPLRPDHDSVSAPGGVGFPKRRVMHQYANHVAHEDRELLSAWRSPTEFLLKSPADDLLKAVPNFQDSVVRIDNR